MNIVFLNIRYTISYKKYVKKTQKNLVNSGKGCNFAL